MLVTLYVAQLKATRIICSIFVRFEKDDEVNMTGGIQDKGLPPKR